MLGSPFSMPGLGPYRVSETVSPPQRDDIVLVADDPLMHWLMSAMCQKRTLTTCQVLLLLQASAAFR